MERLKAFTLLEITVAMLLTGILAALAYGIVGSFNSVAQRSFGLGNDLQQVRDLQLALVADADRSSSLTLAEDGFVFNRSTGSIRYARIATGMVRTAELQVDTFFVPVAEIRGYWSGQRATGTGAPMEQVTLVTQVTDDPLELSFTQYYDAVTRRTFE